MSGRPHMNDCGDETARLYVTAIVSACFRCSRCLLIYVCVVLVSCSRHCKLHMYIELS